MSNSDALDRANSLIKMGQNYLAVPILEEHIRQNQRDYRAWGLMALAQDDPRLKRQCLERVIQLTTDPRMAAWAKQKLAELDPAPSFDLFAEPPSAPAAPRPVIAKPTPQSTPDAKKPDYLLLGGFAAIVVLLIVIGVGAFTLLPNLQNRNGTQVAAQNPPTQPPTLTAWPSTTPRPTLTSAPSRTPKPTKTGTPLPTETPTAGPTATLSPAGELVAEAHALLNVWEVDQAFTQLNRAIQLDPANVAAYVLRARAYFKIYDENRAQADPETATALDANHIDVLLLLGDGALDDSDYSTAIQYYQKAIKQDARDPRPYEGLGFVYEAQNNPDKALQSYETMLEVDPDNADAYNNIGHLYYYQEQYGKALENFQMAYTFDPLSSAIVINVANANKHLGDLTTALHFFDEAVQIAPKASHVYLSRGFFYLETGDYQQAAAEFTKSLNQRYAVEKSSYYFRGVSYLNLQQYSRAKSDFDQAIDFNPTPCAYHNRCSAEVGTGSYSRAVEDCTIAINGGGPVDALFTRARAYDGLGRYQEALADYQSYMLYASPNSPAGKYALERIEALSGQLAVCQSNGSPVCSGSEIALLSVSEQGSAPLLFCNH